MSDEIEHDENVTRRDDYQAPACLPAGARFHPDLWYGASSDHSKKNYKHMKENGNSDIEKIKN
ncbi:MAG: hypothetical protein WD431_13655 [Cyclobacteriaceae bacterium]